MRLWSAAVAIVVLALAMVGARAVERSSARDPRSIAAPGLPQSARSDGERRSDVAYTGRRTHVSAAAVVDFRSLARLDRRAQRTVGRVPLDPPELPEVEPPQRRSGARVGRVEPMSAQTKPSAVASPYVSASFLGQADVPAVGTTKTESPPDTNGAVGRDNLMVPLNSNYVIERKSDGRMLRRVSMTTFWRRVGARNPVDPRVLYDPYNDRWLASAVDNPLLPNSILYGISDTGDPLGKWHLFALKADPTGATRADFPTLGFNQTTVAIGINMFEPRHFKFVRGRLIVLDYASLRAGTGGRPVDLRVPEAFALQPAVAYSPTEATLYLVEHVDSLAATYRFWSLSGTTLTLVGGAPKVNPLGPFGTPGPGNLLPQQGRAGGLDSGDARVGNAVFRNGHVWYAQTIGMPPGGTGYAIHTAVQWVELDTNGGFVQGGRVEDPGANPWNGGHSYAFASLAVNAKNDVLIGFSEFESDDYVDAGYAFREGTDLPGTLRAPVTLKDGEGPYEKRRRGRNRWGDYSGTQVDPSDDLTLWTLQEYARVPAGRGDRSGRWGVWWGRVGGGPQLAPPQCLVPRVVGNSLTKAWRRIVAAHCRVGTVYHLRSAKKVAGRVVRQRPVPGRRLPGDSRVDLVVAG